MPRKKKEESEKVLTRDECLANLQTVCMQLGVTYVQVDYDGSGDSGQVGEVHFFKVNTAPKIKGVWHGEWFATEVSTNIKAPYLTDKQQLDGDKWIKVHGCPALPLVELFQQYCYDMLDSHCPGDWVNNEGGHGQLHIYFNPWSVKLDFWQRTEEHYGVQIEGEEVEE